MDFKRIFSVFSIRQHDKTTLSPISTTLKSKIIMLCEDVFSGNRSYSTANYDPTREWYERFWGEIHSALKYRHGTPILVPQSKPKTTREDVIRFLEACTDSEFLDFVELIFNTEVVHIICSDANLFVDEINELFQSEDAGYELTHIVYKRITLDDTNKGSAPVARPIFPVNMYSSSEELSYPKIILKEDQVIHQEILKPALNLLIDVRFANANKEYLEAFEYYRKGDFRGCLTMCCSALESVLKIICTEKKWGYSANDTADKLIFRVVTECKLPDHFKQSLLSIPTLRNKLGKDHGAGPDDKVVPRYLARYALNETASVIILLVEATRE